MSHAGVSCGAERTRRSQSVGIALTAFRSSMLFTHSLPLSRRSIEFVPEMGALLGEINELLAHGTSPTIEAVGDALSPNNAALFAYLPLSIRKQLLADRDPHGA